MANQDGHNSQHFLFLCYKGLFLLEIPETSNLESLRCKEQTVFYSDKTALEWSQTGTKWFLSAGVVTDALWEWLATCPHRVPSWHINCTLSALWVISWLFLNHSPSWLWVFCCFIPPKLNPVSTVLLSSTCHHHLPVRLSLWASALLLLLTKPPFTHRPWIHDAFQARSWVWKAKLQGFVLRA